MIAGGGLLPVEVAQGLVAQGSDPFVIQVEGETDPSTFAAFDGATLTLEEMGLLVPLLRREGIARVVLAGNIERRPRWWRLRPTLEVLRMIRAVLASRVSGDDGALSRLVRYLEGRGIEVLGAHEIVPDLLAPEGFLTRRRPNDADRRDLAAAEEAARAIGVLDIGQGAVAVGGRVIALEGIEGTDGLLERVRTLRDHGRIAGERGGVLVKCAKPQQELRADLPTIGPVTVVEAHAAGLAGIGVEAGRSIVLESGAVVRRANELGLFVVGLPEGGR